MRVHIHFPRIRINPGRIDNYSHINWSWNLILKHPAVKKYSYRICNQWLRLAKDIWYGNNTDFSTLRLSDTLVRHHWFRQWIVTCSAPYHCLNQWWSIVNWTLMEKISEILIKYKCHTRKFHSENIVCKMAAFLSRPQCFMNGLSWALNDEFEGLSPSLDLSIAKSTNCFGTGQRKHRNSLVHRRCGCNFKLADILNIKIPVKSHWKWHCNAFDERVPVVDP